MERGMGMKVVAESETRKEADGTYGGAIWAYTPKRPKSKYILHTPTIHHPQKKKAEAARVLVAFIYTSRVKS